MLTLIILFILFIGSYSGYKKGLIDTLVRTIAYSLTVILALNNYQAVSEYLYLLIPYPTPFTPTKNPYAYYDMSYLFSLDRSYYYLISFLLILIIGWLFTRLINQLISYYLEAIPVPKPFNQAGGALLSFAVHYLSIFLILFILTTIPYDAVQTRLTNSTLANQMITASPIVSKASYDRFIQKAYEEETQERNPMKLEDLKEVKDDNNEDE